jgi:phosphatidate cytidylyltransferase
VPPLFRFIIYVYSFIALCSAFGILHPKFRGPAGKPVRRAINSWWPPAIAGGITVTAPTWIGTIIVAAVSVWTLHEYLGMLPTDGRNSTVEFLAYLAVPLHYGLLLAGAPFLETGTAIWIFAVLPLAWIFAIGPRGVLSGLPRLQWGLVLTVGAIGYVARMRMFDSGLTSFLLLLVMTNDAAQYVFGKLFGTTTLSGSVSPKKTWEGFAGGMFTTTVVAVLSSSLLTPFSMRHAAFIGALLSVAGLLGDLLVSAIKRDAGVKDTGAVLPEHGGVLDRCDSLLIAAPLFFYVVQVWLP